MFRSTPGIQVGQQFFHRRLHAVEIGEFVRGTIAAAFRTGAVVPRHENYQRVVQFTRRTNGVDDSADRVISVFQKACVDFRLPGVKALLVRRQAVPGWNRIRTGGQFCALRNETEGDLARQTLLAHHVPAFVECAFPALRPLLRRLMRSSHGARRKIKEEGPIGCHGLLEADPVHGLICHVSHKIVAGSLRRLDALGSIDDRW